ncbi:MAG: hypothetical protein AMXMBFR84_00320 [Candidatus Hydrogenedentota bacterium]
MQLTPSMKKFILHWGEMGARWGVTRTVAQVHALLYVTAKPLPADEIAETLSIARSNVSTTLKELQGWGIVRVSHVMGDRREHFETVAGVWEMFMTILDERKHREMDPTIQILRESIEFARNEGNYQEYERLSELLEFFETMSRWYGQIRRMPTPMLRKLASMGDKMAGLAEKLS